MKREAALLGLGLLLGCGIGLGVAMHSTPPAAEPSPSSAPTIAADPAPVAPGAAPPSAAATREETSASLCAELTRHLAAPNPLNDWQALERTLMRWAEADPWEALAFVDQAPRFPMRNSALAIPLAAIARRDPTVAAAWMREHSTERGRRILTSFVVAAIADSHPREALVLGRTPDLGADEYLLGYPLGRLAAESPTEALAAFATTRGYERLQAAELIGAAWIEQDPEAALRWCASLRDPAVAGAAANGTLMRLAERDPAAAAAALLRLQPPRDATCSALCAIARSQPALALECLSALPAALVPDATTALARDAFGTAPDQFVSRLRTHLAPGELTEALRRGWEAWHDSDSKAAEAWADQVADPDLRARLVDIRLTDSAAAEPRAFLASLDNVPDAHLETASIRVALENLPPADAAHWISGHLLLAPPDTTLAIARNFAVGDAAAAARWADTLPPGGLRDHTLATIAMGESRAEQLAESERTLAKIGNPQVCLAARFQVFAKLHGQDPAIAEAWLATQPLSAEVQASWTAIATTNLVETHCD